MTVALDLFAGHGWGVACRRIGIDERGVEKDDDAIATRDLNGFATIFRDVWTGLDDPSLVPEHDGEISSPPCQTFSSAGGGAGRRALDEVLQLVHERAYLRVADMRKFAERHGDERTALVLAPLAYAARHLPRWVVMEQVPPVLPVWKAIGWELRRLGYSVWTGLLDAERYGVPQTRKRAILIARRDGVTAAPPTPTHSRYYPGSPAKLDQGLLPWVSMADALGWGSSDAPSPTVTGGGTGAGGGAEVFATGGRQRVMRSTQRTGHGENAGEYAERSPDRPAFTVTANADRNMWTFDRPATTIAGDSRVWPPGHKVNADDRRRFADADEIYGDRAGTAAIRVTPEEAAALQTYPPEFRFAGTKTSVHEQIGNAVPPLLAEAILRPLVEEIPADNVFELMAP